MQHRNQVSTWTSEPIAARKGSLNKSYVKLSLNNKLQFAETIDRSDQYCFSL